MDHNIDEEIKNHTQNFIDRYLAKYGAMARVIFLKDLHSFDNISENSTHIAIYYHELNLPYPSIIFRLANERLVSKGFIVGSLCNDQKKTTGRISKTEFLGLLIHSGFTVIEEHEVDNFFWFAAEKNSPPKSSSDLTQAKRLVFTQKRIGKNGKIIKVYKLRTMYPLSYLVQDYMISKKKFGQMGKISDDFRITPFGKWLRKYWIDELPQVLNILKGEMTLVGLRPLSESFFRQLPPDLQRERVKFLPGLIPPIYAERPQNFDQRIAAEWKYLKLRKRYGMITDVVYFFRTLGTILFAGQRGN